MKANSIKQIPTKSRSTSRAQNTSFALFPLASLRLVPLTHVTNTDVLPCDDVRSGHSRARLWRLWKVPKLLVIAVKSRWQRHRLSIWCIWLLVNHPRCILLQFSMRDNNVALQKRNKHTFFMSFSHEKCFIATFSPKRSPTFFQASWNCNAVAFACLWPSNDFY